MKNPNPIEQFLREYITALNELLEQWLIYYALRHDHKPPPFTIEKVDMFGENGVQRVYIITPIEGAQRVELDPTPEERVRVVEEAGKFAALLKKQGIPEEIEPEEIVIVELHNEYTVAFKVSTKEALGLGAYKSAKQIKHLDNLITMGVNQFLEEEVDEDEG